MKTISTDVLVVGAGPSGLTAAMLLAEYGVSALTITRYPSTAHTPRAHITNIRTMEIFRDLGIVPDVERASQKLSYLRHNVMANTLAGMEISRYRSYGTPADRLSDYAEASPCVPLNCPQHVMEPVVLKAARDRGADIRFSNELLELEQTADEVKSRIRDRETGEEYLVVSRYVIGADGGRSTVAEQLGIEFEGEAGLQSMVNVWIDADLEKYTAYRPSVLYAIYQPGTFGFGSFINVTPWNDWIFVSQGPADTPESVLLERVRAAIGDPDVEIRVKNIIGWQVNHLFATKYSKGRVFIAGDAAHRHPPSGGLGTNTSVQDAYNLAWKLALVLSGKAGEGLLQSYHDERQPVGKAVVERAMKSLHNSSSLGTVLGARPGQSAEEGEAALRELFSDKPGAAERRQTLAAGVRMQNYRSNALGVELGQRYVSDVIVDDSTPFPAYVRDPELYYHPTTHPGAHLPHAWIEHDHKEVSVMDLAGHGRFCLIVGIGGQAWAQAAAEVSAEVGIDLPVRQVGYRCEYDDVLGDWTRIREVDDDGALLVRPDLHIAWRCKTAPADRKTTLRSVLRQVLALEA